MDGAVQSLKKGTYNKFVDDNLPYRKRLGKILREDYWNIFPEEKETYLKDVGSEEIQAFVAHINTQPDKSPDIRLPQMTSGFFFNCCKLGNAANHYKDADTLTGRQLYVANADGRDDGLLELDEDSSDEFSEWYHNRHIAAVIRGKYAVEAIRHTSHYMFITTNMAGIFRLPYQIMGDPWRLSNFIWLW